VVVGTGLSGTLTVNVWAFEVPPPGVGLKTVMSKVPAVVRSEVRMVAVILAGIYECRISGRTVKFDDRRRK